MLATLALITAAPGIAEDCSFNGIALQGPVAIVESFPDIRVQVVTSFPDLKVKTVAALPDECGTWEFVDSFPDFTIQFVTSFPDIRIEYVTSFPGMP
ncbi:hypothetical protein [Maricaulis sp.]|uniref:hypothetical protein n=1 Tax=Maricaulis sp. TaxID=1486257 RepID=UPI0025BAEF01|nr:hypothetical protein [Maricaulis sp.]